MRKSNLLNKTANYCRDADRSLCCKSAWNCTVSSLLELSAQPALAIQLVRGPTQALQHLHNPLLFTISLFQLHVKRQCYTTFPHLQFLLTMYRYLYLHEVWSTLQQELPGGVCETARFSTQEVNQHIEAYKVYILIGLETEGATWGRLQDCPKFLPEELCLVRDKSFAVKLARSSGSHFISGQSTVSSTK